MKRKIIISGIICVLIIFGCTIYSLESTKKQEKTVLTDSGAVFGKNDAQISIYFFSSLSCSKCKELSHNFDKVIKPKIDRGEVKFIYKMTDDYVYNWNDERFCNWDFITSAYKNWVDLSLETDLQTLTDDERKKRSEQKITIEKEMKELSIEGLPVFYINSDKYIGYYSSKQIEEMIKKYEEVE